MIVKNERDNLKKYFEKNMSYCDVFCIVDTGSTDDTIDTIHHLVTKNKFKGRIFTREWVNFAHNRNECLELGKDFADWSLMLDADDNLEGEKFKNLDYSKCGYMLKLVMESTVLSRPHLFNNDFNWKYKGALHEYVYCIGESPTLYDERTYMTIRCDGCRSKDPNKYVNDAIILENELLKPDCDVGRTLFYLAESYKNYNDMENAIKYYKLRTEFKGWNQEAYVSYMSLIELTDDIDEKLKFCYKAQNLVNTRKDAVYLVLQYARKKNIFTEEIFTLGNAYLYVKMDSTHLFVNSNAYNWSYYDELSIICYYTKRYDLSKTLSIAIQNICPPDQITRIQQNISCCNATIQLIVGEVDVGVDVGVPRKIIVGLTTIPQRINTLGPTLMSLLQQTRKADEIVLTVPKYCARFNTPYEITDRLLLELIKQKKVILNEIEFDYGCATKFVGLLHRDYEDDDILMWVDDDMIYSKNVIKGMADSLTSNCVLCYSGFNFNTDNDYVKVVNHLGKCEILEGFSGVMTFKSNMPTFDEFEKTGIRVQTQDSYKKMDRFTKAQFMSDDFTISSYFHSKNIDTLVCYKSICNFTNCVIFRDTNDMPEALRNQQEGGNMLNYNILRGKIPSHSQACQDKFVLNILKQKRNDYFLEIGSNHPININNSYTLEKNYDWKGVMVEYEKDFLPLYVKHRPNSIHIINDATQIDYQKVFKENDFPTELGYLQIDLEVNNRSTLTTLEILDNTIFDKYKFAVVTFEHDIYTGNFFNTREVSREIFNKRGYICVFKDVCDHRKEIVFEDWYIHPDLVDMEYVNKVMLNNNQNYDDNAVTYKSINCQNIMFV